MRQSQCSKRSSKQGRIRLGVLKAVALASRILKDSWTSPRPFLGLVTPSPWPFVGLDQQQQPPPNKRTKSSLFSSYERLRSNTNESQSSDQVTVSETVRLYLEFVRRHSLSSADNKWKAVQDEKKFAIMHKLLEKVFCSPATSAPVERVFSHSGLFMRPNRARMGDRMLSDLVFLKCNKHI